MQTLKDVAGILLLSLIAPPLALMTALVAVWVAVSLSQMLGIWPMILLSIGAFVMICFALEPRG